MSPLRGFIEVFERGAWVADVVLPDPYEGSFEVGGDPWTGTAMQTRSEGGSEYLRIVGGKGKLGSVLVEKWYRGGGTGNTIAGDICKAAGEASDISLPARAPQYWRHKGPAGRQLDILCDLLLSNWWVDRSGIVKAGVREGAAIDLALPRIASDTDGSVTLSVETTKGIDVGMTYDGRTVRHVRFVFAGNRTLAELSFTPLVLADTERPLDYTRPHKAVVESQASNGTLTVIVDGRFTLSAVVWLGGIPAKIKINPGDLVTCGFWNGDPRQPYAHSLVMLTAGAPSARVQDPVECGTLLIGQNPSSFVIAAVYVPPTPWPTPDDAGKAAAAATHAAAVAAAASAMAATPPVGTFALSGLIAGGDPRVLH